MTFSALESTLDTKPTSFYSILTDAGTGSISRKAVLHFATSQNRKSQNHGKIAQSHCPAFTRSFLASSYIPKRFNDFFLSKLISEPEALLGIESQKISELTELAGLQVFRARRTLRTFWPLGVPTRVEPISGPI